MRVEHVHFDCPREASRVSGCWRSLALPSLIAGMAASAVTFASISGGMPALSSDPGSPGGLIAAVFEAIQSETELRASAGSQVPKVRLASLQPDVMTGTVSAAGEGQATGPVRPRDRTSFDERFNSSFGEPFSPGERFSSFDEHFAATPEGDRARTLRAPELGRDSLARPDSPQRLNARATILAPAGGATAVTRGSVTAALSKPTRPTDTRSDPTPAEPGPRTAIYDITARVVYLPNGKKLEAHSGLGEHMDDPRSVAVKNRGVTPPNVYQLSLRERPFHGVRAIRMTPAEPDKMFGRDGILVHSHLLGPKGESNGCVSIGDYSKFLEAFENGEIDRLMVVERLEAPPDAKTGIGWLPERIKALFRWS
jgi:type VI secretion system (T6SS) effector TldE1-like protein